VWCGAEGAKYIKEIKGEIIPTGGRGGGEIRITDTSAIWIFRMCFSEILIFHWRKKLKEIST